MTALPHDPAMPGLAVIGDPAFADMLRQAMGDRYGAFGTLAAVKLIRVRHRMGERAIVQADLVFEGKSGPVTVPASLWLFAGNKALKRATRARATGSAAFVHEPQSQALAYIFPADPHVPGMARFAAGAAGFACLPAAFSGCANLSTELVRYRPGLGATFRCRAESGALYVKVFGAYDVERQARTLSALRAASRGRGWTVPGVAGMDATLPAIAVRAVRGTVFADALASGREGAAKRAVRRVLDGLADFHESAPVPASEAKTREHFIERALAAADLIARLVPQAGPSAATLARWLPDPGIVLAEGPAHCDMKAEHIVLRRGRVVLLDLDSFAASDPLYDLAMLDMRIAALRMAGLCLPRIADDAAGAIREAALGYGESGALARYAWLRACAALQVAKHFAQNEVADQAWRVGHALTLGHESRALCKAQLARGAAPAPASVIATRLGEDYPCVSS